MKKVLIIFAIAGLMMACNSRSKGQRAANENNETRTTQSTRDISGTYKGVLPTASGSGMDETIILGANNTYKKSYFYVGEDEKPYESSGKFTWDAAGSVITLVGEEAPNQYVVGTDRLTQLDTEGKKITGGLADQYILRKQ